MANKTKDYYPQEKGVIRRDRAGEFRDIMARELMFEALGLIPFAGTAGKFGKAMRSASEYTSQFKPVGKQSISRESAKFKKDLLSGKVDSYGKPQTDVGRSHHAKYGPHYTDAGIESRMGTDKIYDSFVKGFKDILSAKHDLGESTLKGKFTKLFKPLRDKEKLINLSAAKYRLREAGVRRGDLKNKAVQEHFLNPAAKQARSELAKQFPKVPK